MWSFWKTWTQTLIFLLTVFSLNVYTLYRFRKTLFLSRVLQYNIFTHVNKILIWGIFSVFLVPCIPHRHRHHNESHWLCLHTLYIGLYHHQILELYKPKQILFYNRYWYLNDDHLGYLEGRYIGQNITLLEDIVLFTKSENKPDIILSRSFEKAINSLCPILTLFVWTWNWLP
jgi:hypothetical protein